MPIIPHPGMIKPGGGTGMGPPTHTPFSSTMKNWELTMLNPGLFMYPVAGGLAAFSPIWTHQW